MKKRVSISVHRKDPAFLTYHMEREMKALGIGLLVSTGAFGTGDYHAHGCSSLKPGTECLPLMSGNIEEFQYEISPYGADNNRNRMHGAISGATGLGVGAVRGLVDGIRSAALGAGYSTFTATLSGSSGSVTFTMNLNTGAWGLRGSGGGGRDDGSGKHRIP